MQVIRTAILEVYGLFVEDGSFALAILLWLGVVAFLLPHLPLPASWRAVVLFLGLIAILLENVQRSARKR